MDLTVDVELTHFFNKRPLGWIGTAYSSKKEDKKRQKSEGQSRISVVFLSSFLKRFRDAFYMQFEA